MEFTFTNVETSFRYLLAAMRNSKSTQEKILCSVYPDNSYTIDFFDANNLPEEGAYSMVFPLFSDKSASEYAAMVTEQVKSL